MKSWKVLQAVWAGENIGRVFMDQQISNYVKLKGVVLDVGGRGEHSYMRFLNKSVVTHLWKLDVIMDHTININGSMLSLPFASNSFDFVLCFNVLEHIFNYSSALQEAHRILKPHGTLCGRVPFLMNVHADPSDYWRYTKWSLYEILKDGCFRDIFIETSGGLFWVMFNLLAPVWQRFGILRIPISLIFKSLNDLVAMLIGQKTNQERYPLGYFFMARV